MERPDRPGYAAAARDALAGRLLDSTLGFMDPCTVCLGDRHGLYGALDGAGSAAAGELAGATGTDEHHAREMARAAGGGRVHPRR